MELRSVFIKNLKAYRRINRLSQMALAESCGTSTSYIGEIEIGKKFPSIEMIQKFADALGIAPYKLFMDEDDIYIPKLSPEKQEKVAAKIQKALRKIISEI